ncbi:MAG: hypothetical protein QG646_3559 [Euryarchaeota archaeon]|nr:hypothetical protein [Euryarchaeota archaeon]
MEYWGLLEQSCIEENEMNKIDRMDTFCLKIITSPLYFFPFLQKIVTDLIQIIKWSFNCVECYFEFGSLRMSKFYITIQLVNKSIY